MGGPIQPIGLLNFEESAVSYGKQYQIKKISWSHFIITWIQFSISNIFSGLFTQSQKVNVIFERIRKKETLNPIYLSHVSCAIFDKLSDAFSLNDSSISDEQLQCAHTYLKTAYCITRFSTKQRKIQSLGQQIHAALCNRNPVTPPERPPINEEENSDALRGDLETATPQTDLDDGSPAAEDESCDPLETVEDDFENVNPSSDSDDEPITDYEAPSDTESTRPPSRLRGIKDSAQQFLHTESAQQKYGRYQRKIRNTTEKIATLTEKMKQEEHAEKTISRQKKAEEAKRICSQSLAEVHSLKRTLSELYDDLKTAQQKIRDNGGGSAPREMRKAIPKIYRQIRKTNRAHSKAWRQFKDREHEQLYAEYRYGQTPFMLYRRSIEGEKYYLEKRKRKLDEFITQGKLEERPKSMREKVAATVKRKLSALDDFLNPPDGQVV